MTPTHQQLLIQLRELHEQMGEVLRQMPMTFHYDDKTSVNEPNATLDGPNLRHGDEAPAIEWLKMMDEPERSQALKWAKSDSVNMLPMRMARSIAEAVNIAFDWGAGGDRMRWLGIYNKYKEANR